MHECWDCERTLQEAGALSLLPDGKAECADCTIKWEEYIEAHPELRELYTPTSKLSSLKELMEFPTKKGDIEHV